MDNIGTVYGNLRRIFKNFFSKLAVNQELAMILNFVSRESFEISPRFRHSIESRIAKLERDAASDEEFISHLDDADHMRRQLRLVAIQRAEALRMRLFLDRARTRLPLPLIEL